ncbi:MAG: XRE family transcriptional regulator [Blastocatellia bacterium]
MSLANSLYVVAHQFNPYSLRIAREYRGLQKNELAQKLDITPSAITQFESGKTKPNAQTVGRISMALNFPPSFFAQPGDFGAISSDVCHFRSLRSCSQMDRRRMVSASAIIGRVVEFVDSRVNLPTEQVTPSTSYRAVTLEEIEHAAAKVRRDWGLGNGPLSNVVHLLESKGILVFRLLSDCKKVDAFSLWHHGRPYVFLNTEKGSVSRSRFDAGHELGHLILHSEYLPGDRAQEEQANRFASSFLLPRESFLAECPRRLVWPHFLELKLRWKVSLAALVRRAKDLELISEDTYRRAHVQLNKKGWANQEPNEPTEVERPTILPQAMKLLEQSGESFSGIAQEISLPESDLRSLIFADGAD